MQHTGAESRMNRWNACRIAAVVLCWMSTKRERHAGGVSATVPSAVS